MMEELECLHKIEGLEFNNLWAHLRCMPHTVHLSAIEVSPSFGVLFNI